MARDSLTDSLMEAFGAAVIGFGFGAYAYGIIRGLRSRTWPTVSGEVTDADVEVFHGRGGVLYTPLIRYTYSVAGRNYESERVLFGYGDFYTRRGAEAVRAAYPTGGAVTVYYDPTDPRSSVLRPGVGTRTWIVLGLFGALLFLVIGLLTGIWS